MGIAKNPDGVGGLGYGQTTNAPAGKQLGVTYYNTKKSPIEIYVRLGVPAISTHQIYVDGVSILGGTYASSGVAQVSYSFIVKPGGSYSFTNSAGAIDSYSELS